MVEAANGVNVSATTQNADTLDAKKAYSTPLGAQQFDTSRAENGATEIEQLPDTLANNKGEMLGDILVKSATVIGVSSTIVAPILSVIDEKVMHEIKSGKKIIDVEISRGLFKKPIRTIKSNKVNWQLYRPLCGTKYGRAAIVTFLVGIASLFCAHAIQKKINS